MTATVAPARLAIEAPRTALHNPLIRALPGHRIAVFCFCAPKVPLSVRPEDDWTAEEVLGVQRQHEAEVSGP